MPRSGLLSISQAVQCLADGEIISYPTEAVYGLGCDPLNETAVRGILTLKNRPESAGLILIADCIQRFEPFIGFITAEQRHRALSTWPGPVTWLFPRSDAVPDWLAGTHPTIALRVTAHSVCRALCAAFGSAIVSTSANPGGSEPARSVSRVLQYFPTSLGGIVEGDVGKEAQPSEIRDLASGRIIRKG